MNIGFSTGSIAHGDFKKGIAILKEKNIKTIELSSLREVELAGLISSIDTLDLSSFNYISFHAPSKLNVYSEKVLVDMLDKVAKKQWLIIVHPDIITDFSVWKSLGKFLCIENMDKRKMVGRTSADMEVLFNKLPDATFCLDVAHARQVDPTMTEALLMLSKFGEKLKQIHLSDVNTESKHEPLNLESIIAYQRLSNYISGKTPIILESPVLKERIEEEIKIASIIFDKTKLFEFLNRLNERSIYFHNYINRYNNFSNINH
jgi:hypothetical protein